MEAANKSNYLYIFLKLTMSGYINDYDFTLAAMPCYCLFTKFTLNLRNNSYSLNLFANIYTSNSRSLKIVWKVSSLGFFIHPTISLVSRIPQNQRVLKQIEIGQVFGQSKLKNGKALSTRYFYRVSFTWMRIGHKLNSMVVNEN